MGLFNRFFGKRKQNRDNSNQNINEKRKEKNNRDRNPSDAESIGELGFTVSFGKKMEVSFSSDPVGDLTGSDKKDFYVYEWFIKDTGEVFYVGKGREDRYKRYHDRAYEAEKIREMYDTDVRFIGIMRNI